MANISLDMTVFLDVTSPRKYPDRKRAAKNKALHVLQAAGIQVQCGHAMSWCSIDIIGLEAHERPRESGSFRMSAMTLFWYCGPMATMEAVRLDQ